MCKCYLITYTIYRYESAAYIGILEMCCFDNIDYYSSQLNRFYQGFHFLKKLDCQRKVGRFSDILLIIKGIGT